MADLVSSRCGMHERLPSTIVLLFEKISHPTPQRPCAKPQFVLLSRGRNIKRYGSLCRGEVRQGLTCL